jgi:enoyl-CoA hydratase/carnithine racemase
MPALLVEIRDDIAYLTLNRPEVHNAINPELMVQLAEAWKRVAADDSVRVVILTGAGDKAFLRRGGPGTAASSDDQGAAA